MSIGTAIKRNLWVNTVSQAISSASQLLALPVLLRALSVAQYGDWIVLSNIAALGGIAELGLGLIAGNAALLSHNDGKRSEAKEILSNQTFIALILAVFIVASGFILGLFGERRGWIVLNSVHGSGMLSVTVFVSLYAASGVLVGALGAYFRVGIEYSNYLKAINWFKIFEFLLLIAGAVLTRSLLGMICGVAVARLILCLSLLRSIERHEGTIKVRIGIPAYRIIRLLAPPIAGFMAFPIANALYFQGITLAVSVRATATGLAIFAVSRTISRIPSQLIMILKQSTITEFANIPAGNSNQTAYLTLLMVETALITAFAFGVASVFLCAPAIELWTGGRLRGDWYLMLILAASALLNSTWYAASSIAKGLNRHNVLAIATIVGSALGFCCASFGRVNGEYWGAAGMLLTEIIILPVALLQSFSIARLSVKDAINDLIYFTSFRKAIGGVWLRIRGEG